MLHDLHGLWSPSVDMYETAEAWIVFVELAGLTAQDIELSIGSNSLLIRGNKPAPISGCIAASLEIWTGRFERELTTPDRIDRDSVTASMSNGLLKVILPKLKPDRVVVPIDPT